MKELLQQLAERSAFSLLTCRSGFVLELAMALSPFGDELWHNRDDGGMYWSHGVLHIYGYSDPEVAVRIALEMLHG